MWVFSFRTLKRGTVNQIQFVLLLQLHTRLDTNKLPAAQISKSRAVRFVIRACYRFAASMHADKPQQCTFHWRVFSKTVEYNHFFDFTFSSISMYARAKNFSTCSMWCLLNVYDGFSRFNRSRFHFLFRQ